jgi:hypothetical protein
MRSIIRVDNIQIEITTACMYECSNCTRFCGHKEPYYMSFDQFKEAINSMEGYPKLIGIMGGEPLLHPDFEKMCRYALTKFPKEKLGLWTTFPKGYEKYREIICETFYHIFLNDHTRDDIYHHPPLVAIEEVISDRNVMWNMIDKCWAQEAWSPSINPKGAYFCEIAASLSMLFDEGEGWKIEPGWWWRTVKDFTSQIEQWCPRCGFACSLPRRSSREIVDDISPKNLERLKGKSYKIDRGEYVISDLKMVDNPEQMASYKDLQYRNGIANRYGMFLILNEFDYLTPYLKKEYDPNLKVKTVYQMYKERWG